MTHPPSQIYQRPRRRGPLDWALRITIALLLLASGVLIGGAVAGQWGPWKTNQPTGPDLGQLQGQIQSEMPHHVSGVVRVACVMPSSWTPGQKFTCYGYGSSEKELAQVDGTVLPDETNAPQWNEAWSVDGPAPTTSPAPSSGGAPDNGATQQASQEVATGCEFSTQLYTSFQEQAAGGETIQPTSNEDENYAFNAVEMIEAGNQVPRFTPVINDTVAFSSLYQQSVGTKEWNALDASLGAISDACRSLGFPTSLPPSAANSGATGSTP